MMDHENHDHGCACGGHSGHGMGIMMDCCQEHRVSREHLEMKKKMLEEKLEWVNGELAKTK